MKVWQYKSKITSEPWITIRKCPTEEELADYRKYFYELRQIHIDYDSTLIGY